MAVFVSAHMTTRSLKTVILAMAAVFERAGERGLRNDLMQLYTRDLQFKAPETCLGWMKLNDWCLRELGPDHACSQTISNLVRGVHEEV